MVDFIHVCCGWTLGTSEDSSACAKINRRISSGVRQGCVASSWLFNLYMDSCVRFFYLEINIK